MGVANDWCGGDMQGRLGVASLPSLVGLVYKNGSVVNCDVLWLANLAFPFGRKDHDRRCMCARLFVVACASVF